MNIVFGVLSASVGIAYSTLGVMTMQEQVAARKVLGWSRSGIGFAAMLFTCGLHHLVHTSHVFRGEDISFAVAAATLMALPPGALFFWFRFEAFLGGPGDRAISGTPPWLAAMPIFGLTAAGALVAGAAFTAEPVVLTTVTFWANVAAGTVYLAVAWPLLRTQFRRRAERDGWSASGLALSMIFPTCALTHFVYATTTTGDIHSYAVDIVAVPSAIYFVLVVVLLYRRTVVDWNVKLASAPARHAPWATPTPTDGDWQGADRVPVVAVRPVSAADERIPSP